MKIWTHRVANDRDYVEATFCDIISMKGVRSTARVRLADVWPVPEIRMIGAVSPTDAFRCGPIEIVSDRLAGVLRSLVPPSEVELLAVDVRDCVGPFFCVNPIGFVDAIDRNQSVYSELNGIVRSVSKLVVDSSAVAGRQLCALDAIDMIWVASEELSSSVVSLGARGIAFEDPFDWTPY